MKKISILVAFMTFVMAQTAKAQTTEQEKLQKLSVAKISALKKQADGNKDSIIKKMDEGNRKMENMISELKNQKSNEVENLQLKKENFELQKKNDSLSRLWKSKDESKISKSYHLEGQAWYDVVHVMPNEWSKPFRITKDIGYDYLNNDTMRVDVKTTLDNGKVIYRYNLSQSDIDTNSYANPTYQWRARNPVDVIIVQWSRDEYNHELKRMAKKGYFKTPTTDFWYMNPQRPKVKKHK